MGGSFSGETRWRGIPSVCPGPVFLTLTLHPGRGRRQMRFLPPMGLVPVERTNSCLMGVSYLPVKSSWKRKLYQ